MVAEGDPFAVGRNLGMADPVDAVEQHLSDGIFQTPVTVLGHVANDGQTVAVGGPVGVLHVVEHFARRSSTERNARQGAAARIATVAHGVETDGELSVFRDGQAVRRP